MPRAIDTFVNVNMGSVERPEWLVRVAEDYFGRAEEIFKDISIDELLEAMDRAGVEKCVVTTNAEGPDARILRVPEQRPDRFVLSLSLDPRNGMKAVRALTDVVRDHPVVLARITSAQPLSDAQRDEIVAALERRFGKRIEAELDVDPELLGGARVQIGDQVIHASVRDALAQMAAALAR